MSRINTNINSLVAQRVLGQQNKNLGTSLERLSTGLRINRAGDDPAGLIASEKLRSENAATTAAISNAERADQVATIAEGGLNEVSSLLTQVQGLVTTTANTTGLSTDERQANQQQIDSILQTIDRISSTTSFGGTKLLNGSLDFTVTGQNSKVTDFTIEGAKIAFGGSTAVNAVVTASAQRGTVYLSAGGTALDLSATTASFAFELGGAKGSRSFSFGSGTTLANIATNINSFKAVTGVSATASGNYIKIKSTDLGSDAFASVKITNAGGQAGGVAFGSSINENAVSTTGAATFSSLQGATAARDSGQDVGATINGIKARGKGGNISVNTDSLAVSLDLTSTGAQTLGSFTALTVTGGGAQFNLGASVDIGNQVRLGIGNVGTTSLGSSSLGRLSDLGSGKTLNVVTGDLGAAQQVVSKAIDQVSNLRGRIGAFQKYTVGSTINSLNVALENTSAAESAIRDTDFAKETANLTRSQILVQAATQTVAISKSQPQNVLSLLQ